MVDVNVTDDRTPPASDPRHAGVEASARQREDESQQHEKRRLSAAVVDVGAVSRHEAEKVHPITGHPRPGEWPGINISLPRPTCAGAAHERLPKARTDASRHGPSRSEGRTRVGDGGGGNRTRVRGRTARVSTSLG